MKLSWSSLLLWAAPALACGPFFPSTVLDRPEEIPCAPRFAFDLTGILPTNAPWRAAVDGTAADLHPEDACLAAYRQGRAQLRVDDPDAVRCFRRTRELLGRCASKADGLGAASIGWEARAQLNLGNLVRAGELYVEHYGTGDPTARMSLRIVAGRILASGPDTLHAAARHPDLSRVVTVYLAARGGPFASAPPPESEAAWLAAVEAAGPAALACADLLAWTAYQTGDFAIAARWLARAPRQSAGTLWLRAKLSLRDGRPDDAAAALAQAVRQFPQAEEWPTAIRQDDVGDRQEVTAFDQARGELAFLRLGRGDYLESLDLLLRAGYWTDAAYLAERVLRIEELIAFAGAAPDDRLRHLLARRLARLGRYAEARPFFPEPLQPKLDELAAALERRDAASLWRAAQILRWHGMELVGTELAPDWHVHGGRYDGGFDDTGLTPVTADVKPPLRFHYRYRAADLAWTAAATMPDGSDATAVVLCEAGTWLKNRDPRAANRFYKALVNRCGRTELGRAAEKLRWFPESGQPPLP